MSLNSGDMYSMEGRNSRSHLSLLFRHGSQDCSFPFRLYFSVKLELELRAEETLWTPALVTRDMFGWTGTHACTVTNQEHTRHGQVSSSMICRPQCMGIEGGWIRDDFRCTGLWEYRRSDEEDVG